MYKLQFLIFIIAILLRDLSIIVILHHAQQKELNCGDLAIFLEDVWPYFNC